MAFRARVLGTAVLVAALAMGPAAHAERWHGGWGHGGGNWHHHNGNAAGAAIIGGLGVNYQKAGGITLAPIRAGVGFRLGANIGYLSYSRKRNILPF